MPPKSAPYYMDANLHAYIEEHAGEDDVLRSVRRYARQNRLPSITPAAGRMLQILARAVQARRILEVGTCTGYSTIWLARGLARAGKVYALEIDPKFIALAAEHAERAGARKRIEFKEGLAAETLKTLDAGSYDLVFIDADKENYPTYFREGLRLLRKGGILAADNMFWGGDVLDAAVKDEGTRALREYTRLATQDDRLLTILSPLGDGLAVSVKVA
ncbi:MAG: O-methyltransferase [Euryarchaeota archaeon]|nr:O-methyltransferase [Euryarchaeota archaeon]